MKHITFLLVLTISPLLAMAEGWKITFDDNYAATDNTAWQTVYAHIWHDGGDLDTWPGRPMVKGEDGKWTFTFEADELVNPKVIFNNGLSGYDFEKKTDDLTLVNGGDYNRFGRIVNKQQTVYFDNSLSYWDNIYVYVYNGTAFEYEPLGGWGNTDAVRMRQGDTGLFSLTFTTSIELENATVIFHNSYGSEENQTENLTFVNEGIYNRGGFTGETIGSSEGIEEEGVADGYFDNLDFEQTEQMTQARAKGQDPDNEGFTLFEDESVLVPSGWDLHYAANSARLLGKPFLLVYGDNDATGHIGYQDAYELTAEVAADYDNGEFNVSGDHFLLANCYYGDYSDMTVISQTSKRPLPKGIYRLSATIDAGGGLKDKIALFAQVEGEETSIIEAPVDYDNTSTSTAGRTALTFTLDEPATVTIGIKTKTLNNPTLDSDPFGTETFDYLWFYADNFELDAEEAEITITTAQYATFFTGHSYIMPDGLEGAFITSYTALDSDGRGTGRVTSETVFTSGDEVPGSTPLLLHATKKISEPTVFKAHITAMEGEAYDGGMENYLYGSATPVTTNVDGNTTDYYFYKFAFGHSGSPNADRLGFYWDSSVANGAAFDIAGHRAWLAIPRSALSNELAARLTGFVISDGSDEPAIGGDENIGMAGDGTTTAITGVTLDSGAPVYNLQGLRVSDLSKKGIYIIGGKKVIVK